MQNDKLDDRQSASGMPALGRRKPAAATATARADSGTLQRLREGDQRAWDDIMSEWGPRLYTYLRYRLPNTEDAEDVLNETMVAAVRSVRTFDGGVSLATWLYTLAHHKSADFWRRNRSTVELSEQLPAAPLGLDLEFYEAFGTLPEASRHALLLRYRDGFGVEEVAHIIGRTYKATESLLSRSRALLRAATEAKGIPE